MAASYSESKLIRYGEYCLVLFPLSVLFMFVWMMAAGPGENDVGDAEKADANPLPTMTVQIK